MGTYVRKFIAGAKVDARAAPYKESAGYSHMTVSLNFLCFGDLSWDNL